MDRWSQLSEVYLSGASRQTIADVVVGEFMPDSVSQRRFPANHSDSLPRCMAQPTVYLSGASRQTIAVKRYEHADSVSQRRFPANHSGITWVVCPP